MAREGDKGRRRGGFREARNLVSGRPGSRAEAASGSERAVKERNSQSQRPARLRAGGKVWREATRARREFVLCPRRGS